MTYTVLLSLIIASFLHAEAPDPPIAIRHDVDDALYLELGSRYPSVVRVGERGGDGTLIAHDWVLTAAHVASGMARRSDGNFRIFVQGVGEGIPVAQVIVHPSFEPMGPNDIALIRLEHAVKHAEPASLYRKRDETGQPIVIVGHGDTKTGEGGEWVVDGKRRGATNIIDNVTDHHIIFDFDEPANATELEGTAGRGDSGGPAFIEIDGVTYLAGVSSLGEPGDNGPGTYGATEHYVRVSSHAKWIDAVLSDPPSERLVNVSDQPRPGVSRRVGPGQRPPGMVVLDEIGLLVAERDGQVRMVGRIDQKYPQDLLDGGIRPPAVVISLNGTEVDSPKRLQQLFAKIPSGATFTLTFDHNGKMSQFELTK